jgi:hypothetical protein
MSAEIVKCGVLLALALCVASCASPGYRREWSPTEMVAKLSAGETVRAKKYYVIGAYAPVEGEYSFRNYDDVAARRFLAGISSQFKDGDIVSVDGLKWVKSGRTTWDPFPNPPQPVKKPDEDDLAFAGRYAEWIDAHPHFGYPPVPIDGKQ